jgi:hypothetical protein
MIEQSHVDNFILCLQEQRFFDAHEALEEVWFPRRYEKGESRDELLLIKGLINAAVSFELIKRGRKKSSVKVWNNYLKYIVLLQTINSSAYPHYITIKKYVENLHINQDETIIAL